jgi:uncharacterized protein with PIN domain
MALYARDTFVELLRRKERGAEDVFFLRRDRELIARLQTRLALAVELEARRSAHMRCPECGAPLTEVVRRGVATEQCPEGHGVWVPPGGLETIPEREHDAWFDRYVHMRW